MHELLDTEKDSHVKKRTSSDYEASSNNPATLNLQNTNLDSFLKTYTINNSQEKEVLENFISKKVNFGCANFEESHCKIVTIAKELLKQPYILFIDEDFLKIPEIKDKFFFKTWFKNFANTTIITILTSFEHLDIYDDLVIFESGSIVEKGTTKNLLEKSDSMLIHKVKQTDIRVYNRLLKDLNIKQKSLVEIHKSYCKHIEVDPGLKNLLKKMFLQYDIDNSDALEKDEITKLLDDICVELSRPEINKNELDELIKYCDTDGNGVFDFQELYDMLIPILSNEA